MNAREWLHWWFGENPQGLIWVGGHEDGFRGRTFTSTDEAAAYAETFTSGGVYHRLSTVLPLTQGRGTARESASLPGFAMDLDLAGPNHKALNYPGTHDDLVEILREAGMPEPSAWVNSGGGRYPYWKFETPADLARPGGLERMAEMSAALHRRVIDCAAAMGWKVDNTSDLARVFRMPGTLNRKTEPHVMCEVVQASGPLHSPERSFQAALSFPSSETSRCPAGVQPVGSQLFAQASSIERTGPREFTLAEALEYVRPALEALEAAQDGSINDRLLAASMTMAHFGPEFWPRELAVTELERALSATVYDGRTWKAHDTINRAYADMEGKDGPAYWHATRRAETVQQAAEQVTGDAVDALLAEMLTDDQLAMAPPPKHLIRDVLTMDSESWLIGPPGSKKSFVALDMAGHVATGKPWQGREVVQGAVIMIVAEGAGGAGKRVKAWRQTYGPMTNVKFLPRPVQAKDLAAWSVLVEACRRTEPALVVIDTQARVTLGLEENAADQMGVYVNAISAIRQATGACVLTIHHSGRRGQDARGSSAIDGAQSTELTVDVAQGKMTGALKVTKQKDIEEGPDIPLHFTSVDVGQDEYGRTITSLVLVADAFRRAAIEGEQGPERSAIYVPTFSEKDRWRQQILDTLYAYAIPNQGLSRAQIASSLAHQEGVPVVKVRENGAFKGAVKALAEAVDPSGEPLLVQYGSGASTRYEVGSLSLLAGLAERLPHVARMSDPE